MATARIILGIDPGYDRCGYGVIRDEAGKSTHILHGVITPPRGELSQRLMVVYAELTRIIQETHPDCAGVENLYFTNNAKTAMAVGQARGIILLALAQQGLSVGEFTPPQIKQAVTGHGQAPKDQMQKMVQLILRLPQLPVPDDAADALAVALCMAQWSGSVWTKK